MAKYTVEVAEVHKQIVQLDYDPAVATADKLREMANEAIQEGEASTLEYSHTLHPELWTVRDKTGKCI